MANRIFSDHVYWNSVLCSQDEWFWTRGSGKDVLIRAQRPTLAPARPRKSPFKQDDELLGCPATFVYGPASLLTGYAIPSRRGRGPAGSGSRRWRAGRGLCLVAQSKVLSIYMTNAVSLALRFADSGGQHRISDVGGSDHHGA